MKGKYNEERKYSAGIDIASYEVDSQFRLKPASFMDMAQEIAYLAATEMGFGYDDLQKKGVVWVLSRMNLKFSRLPLWRESVVLTTWHKGPKGPFFIRDFKMTSATGEVLVLGTSSWVMMDIASRRLCRAEDMIPDETSCKDDAIAVPAGKVVMPKGVEPEIVGTHEVRYSDVDIVGHTNNARYVVWSMDTIDYNELKNAPVKELTINFNHETRPGEAVQLCKAVLRDEECVSYYIDGRSGDRQVFCVKIDI